MVKINGMVHEIGYRNPEEYKIVRLLHEVKNVITKYRYDYNCQEDKIETSVVLPWIDNGERKLITKDSDLYSVFEEFFIKNYPAIEFEVKIKNSIEQNHREWLSKIAPAFLERMDRNDLMAAGLMFQKFPMEKRRKDNRGFAIKSSALNNSFGHIQRRTRIIQGVMNGQEVGSSSGQTGQSSTNATNARQAMELQETGSKDEEVSPWACF